MYCSYEKHLLARNFKVRKGERLLGAFLHQHELHGINKNPKCYKSPSNIDLILTNRFLKPTKFHRSISFSYTSFIDI